MMTYFTAFIFYTLAMVGVLLLGFVIYKKTMINNGTTNKGMIKILDSIAIAPKKTLMVVKIKNERFLIASGAEHTTFLSKLAPEENQAPKAKKNKEISEVYTSQVEEPETLIQQVPVVKEITPPVDMQKLRLEKIEQQLKNIYSQNPIKENVELSPVQKLDTRHNQEQYSTRREMIKSLLRDLNETTNANVGSKF